LKREEKEKLLKLEYYRKYYGFTQKQLGRLIGLKDTSAASGYSSKVNRRSPLTYDEMRIIMSALNKKAEKAGEPLLTLNDVFLN
jgi:transcriptional regulator with XRE-family HTH domain